jgi:hypothetical protein
MWAVIVKQRGVLWGAWAYTSDKHGQTLVSVSWHRTRTEAVAALAWHF